MRKFVLVAAAAAGVLSLSACKSNTDTVATDTTETVVDTAAMGDASAEASMATDAAMSASTSAAEASDAVASSSSAM